MFLPELTQQDRTRQMTASFLGLNRNQRCAEGEFSQMRNLCSLDYPVLSVRPKRGIGNVFSDPQGLCARDALAVVDGSRLYYNGLAVAGVTLSTLGSMQPKTMVSMGAYLVIFPDKVYVNTQDLSDIGYLEQKNEAGGTVTFSLCTASGEGYASTPTVAAAPPDNAQNGALWIDTSAEKHALKQYSSTSSMWVPVATTYIKISANGIGQGFKAYDGVSVSGCTAQGTEDFNKTMVAYAVSDNYIVVVGLLEQTVSQQGGVSVARTVPELDFVCEANNRLWGCHYGLAGGKVVNEIYCSALGDFKNWNRFLGVSTDSFTASVGTDGPFTGAVNFLGSPIFFKENCYHKVYISGAGAHQIVSHNCPGVQKGSEKSLCIVGETLYYKGASAIYAFDGASPVSVSGALGTLGLRNAVAGALGSRYFAAMDDSKGNTLVYVYDTAKGLWHCEDGAKPMWFARRDEELYYIDRDSKALMAVAGSSGTLEGAVGWEFTTGVIGYEEADRQYLSRLQLRMQLPFGSQAELYIEYDSSGGWEALCGMTGMTARSFTVPVQPRRCDHFRLRMQGKGECRIFSLVKVLESGSERE